jgi:histidinol-phosphate aminotransferase
MSANIQRRQLLKQGVLLAGALPFASPFFQKAVASPGAPRNNFAISDLTLEEQLFQGLPPDIKARLSANENPFGPSEKAKQAAMDALGNSFRYGFGQVRELQQLIAKEEGVSERNILLSAGSSGLLDAAAIAFAQAGGNIISADPSYRDLPDKGTEFNCEWVKVPLTVDYKTDLDAMEKRIDAKTNVVYICNPNNPTATVVDTNKLIEFCKRVSQKVPVFVDEAYIDYLPDVKAASMIPLVKEGLKNIMVVRTFSKLYGFAGLRIGYMIADKETLDKVQKYAQGGNAISVTSAQAAVAAYQDKEFMKEALKKTLASRDYLYGVLKAEGYEYVPSSANFVLFPIKMDSMKFVQEMGKRGVSVRSWKFNGKEWCRVSVGRMDEMEAFAAAFKEIS